MDYDFSQHVASDIGIDEKFLPPESYSTQETLDTVSQWTQDNLMKLNEEKCKYMAFSRSESKFATRLKINDVNLERVSETKLLGVWISDDLSWTKNCKEICVRAFSRLSMITKLKYVGTSIEDLIDVYVLYIRSVAEYCSVAYHSSLTQAQSEKIERIQKTCLRVILGDMYVSYDAALEMCGLKKLSIRREQRCLNFSMKCVKHEKNSRLFPLNTRTFGQEQNTKEAFVVNWARTGTYQKSAIPYCQRLLNKNFSS